MIHSSMLLHEVEYKTEYEASVDNKTQPSIDSAIQPTIDKHPRESIDKHPRESIDSSHENDTFALPEHYYPSFAVNTQPQISIDYHYGDTISRHGDYFISSLTDEIVIMRALQWTLHYLRCDLTSITRTTTKRRLLSTVVLPWTTKEFFIYHMHIRKKHRSTVTPSHRSTFITHQIPRYK